MAAGWLVGQVERSPDAAGEAAADDLAPVGAADEAVPPEHPARRSTAASVAAARCRRMGVCRSSFLVAAGRMAVSGGGGWRS